MNSRIKSCEWWVAGSGRDYGRKEAQEVTKKEKPKNLPNCGIAQLTNKSDLSSSVSFKI